MMSPLNRIAIGVALSLFAATPTFAQNQPNASTTTATPGSMIDGQANPYHLTAAQQAKITARKLKFQQDATAVAHDGTLTTDVKNKTIAQMEIKAAADVKSYLTPAQRVQVDAQQAVVQQTAQAHAAEIKQLQDAEAVDETRYKATKTALISSLSNDQMGQIIALEQATKAKLEKLQADTTVSDADKSTQGAAIVADHDAKQKALFNPQQIALVHKMETISADGAAKAKQLDSFLPPIVLPVK